MKDYMGVGMSWRRAALPGDQDACNCEHVRAMLAKIDPRACRILRAWFGIDQTRQTLREIGKSEGVSLERVRQIQMRALERLRYSEGVPLGEWKESGERG